MADIVDKATRSRMMSGIKGKNTKPELAIRKGLHRRGFRYQIHRKDIPGKPDLVFPKYKAVIFVHGCFWHGHDCKLFKWPKQNQEFWRKKITSNIARDSRHLSELNADGWRTLVVWECSLRGKESHEIDQLLESISSWLLNI